MFWPRRTVGRKWWHWVAVAGLLGSTATVLVVAHQFATAAVSPGATELLSVTADGSGNHASNSDFHPSISANGRYVAFTSEDQLDPIDRPHPAEPGLGHERDVYVRDTLTQHTVLMSRNSADTGQSANGSSFRPSISGDGRFVAFVTKAPNIVADASVLNLYLVIVDRDPTGTGNFDTNFAYTQVRRMTNRGEELGDPSLSADATRVGYEELVPNPDAGATVGVFLTNLHHGDHGQLLAPTDADRAFPPLPSDITIDTTVFGRQEEDTPALSADGSHLLMIARYESEHFSLIEAAFDFDVAAGTATRVDLDENGQPISKGSNFVSEPAISGNGRLVAFAASVPAEPLSVVRIVDRDPDGDGVFGPADGQPVTSTIAGRDTAGAVVSAQDPAFSADGRYFAFVTDAAKVHNGVDTLHPPDTFNTCLHVRDSEGPPLTLSVSACDVVVRDLIVDRQRVAAGLPRLPAELASPSRLTTCTGFTPGATCEGGNDSTAPVLDADGSAVAYTSNAQDLVTNATNGFGDLFERHFQPRLAGTPLDFGGLHLDEERTLAVPVSHSGFGPLSVTTATVTGTNKADFTLVTPDTCTNALLHETDQCLVTVHFKPGALGLRTATLAVSWRGGADAVVEIPLSGTGTITPVPGFSVNPDPVNFGERPVTADSPPAVVTVTNTGTGALTISAVNIFAGGGPAAFPTDYRITAQTCTGKPVAPAATCQVTIIQRPLGTGVRPAALSFTDDGLPAGPHLIPMNGSGAIPKLLASPAIAQPGRVSQISGTAFPPGQPVHVTLDAMPGTTTVTTNAAGGFTTPLVILPHTFPGPRQLHATVTVTNGLPTPVTVTLTIPFLVVPGTLEPPDFSVRN